MFDFLRPKPDPKTATRSPYLPFKSSEAAFEYACKLHRDAISEGSGHVGLVLDGRKLFGAEVAIRTREDGSQLAVLMIANANGGFIVSIARGRNQNWSISRRS